MSANASVPPPLYPTPIQRLAGKLDSPAWTTASWRLWAVFGAISWLVTWRFATDVPSVYRNAALRWFAGAPLYDGSGLKFIYLPQSSILYAPLALLPDWLSGDVWRLVNLAVLAAGIWRLAEMLRPRVGAGLFPLFTLVSIPLAWSAARHGQMTLAMGGFMMLAVADLAERRWGRAAAWLCLGVALKPLMVVLLLLAVALFRPLWWRVPAGLLLVFALPFALQRPDYVLAQYADCLQTLRVASNLGVMNAWADLFGAANSFGLNVPGSARTAIRLGAALATLLICALALRRRQRLDAHFLLFAFAVCYLLLLNPRTENNTYALMGPPIAGSLGLAIFRRARPQWAATYATIALLFLLAKPISRLLPLGAGLWPKPVLCALFVSVLLAELYCHRGGASECAGGRRPCPSPPGRKLAA